MVYLRSLCYAGFAAFVASSCAMQPQIKDVVIDYNEMVAQTVNREILANIIRASRREGTHYTTIGQFSGTANLTAMAGTGSTFTGQAATNSVAGASLAAAKEAFTPSASLSVTTGTSFDVGVNTGRKFYNGILDSISVDLIGNYIEQGFSSDLILALFVREVTLEKLRFLNAPDSDDPASKLFPEFVQNFELVFKRANPADNGLFQVLDKNMTPVLSAGSPKSAFVDLALSQEGYSLGKVTGQEGIWLRLQPPSQLKISLKDKEKSKISPSRYISDLAKRENVNFDNANIKIRTTDGIIYYVGEYIRLYISDKYDVENCKTQKDRFYFCVSAPGAELKDKNTDGVPLVLVRRGASDETPFIRLDFPHGNYYVPSAEEELSRSSQVFTIIQQLLNLRKEAEEQPLTSIVRVRP